MYTPGSHVRASQERRSGGTVAPVRVTVRPNNLRQSGSFGSGSGSGSGLLRTNQDESTSSSAMRLMPRLTDSDSSSDEGVSEEDDIPEVIGEAEYQEDSSEDDLVPPRYLARSAPPGSLQHLNSNGHDNVSSREQYYLSGQGGTLCDSDDDYDAYAGEEFEGELDEDGQRLYNQDDYELGSRYRQQLHFYDRMLAQREQERDLDNEAVDCNEISDADDGYDDYIQDMRSENGEGYLSDEERMDPRELATIHGQRCAQFVTSSRHEREVRELSYQAMGSSSDALNSYQRQQRPTPDARRLMGLHGAYSRHYGYEEQDTDRLKNMALSTSNPSTQPSWSSSWLNSGLYCSSLFKKKPSEEMRKVLDDKSFVYGCLKDLPGVNPDDVRIQGVLAALRGLPTSVCTMLGGVKPQLSPQAIGSLAIQYGPGPSKHQSNSSHHSNSSRPSSSRSNQANSSRPSTSRSNHATSRSNQVTTAH